VATPSFVADCLETLEEVRVRAAEDFRKFGGELLVTVPCLNADQAWIKAASQIALSELENAPIYTGGAESGPSRSD
jgi:ferrochelatase